MSIGLIYSVKSLNSKDSGFSRRNPASRQLRRRSVWVSSLQTQRCSISSYLDLHLLLACSMDLKHVSPNICLSQFLKINLSFSLPLFLLPCLLSSRHTSYSFCFSGEPWVMQLQSEQRPLSESILFLYPFLPQRSSSGGARFNISFYQFIL